MGENSKGLGKEDVTPKEDLGMVNKELLTSILAKERQSCGGGASCGGTHAKASLVFSLWR